MEDVEELKLALSLDDLITLMGATSMIIRPGLSPPDNVASAADGRLTL